MDQQGDFDDIYEDDQQQRFQPALPDQHLGEQNYGGIFIDARRMVFRIDGGPEMIRALKEAAPVVAGALTGMYVVFKVLNHTGFLDSLIGVFRSVEGVTVERVSPGSVTVTILTETEISAKIVKYFAEEGIFLGKLNKSLQEYVSKFNDPQPEFTNVTLVEEKSSKISQEEFEDLKQQAEEVMQDAIENGIKIGTQRHTSSSTENENDSSQLKIERKSLSHITYSEHLSTQALKSIIIPEFLTLEDLTSIIEYNRHLELGSFKRARSIEKNGRPLHPDWHYTGRLIQQYKLHMDAREMVEANQARKALCELLRNSLLAGVDLNGFANFLTDSGYHVIGILFFIVSSELQFHGDSDKADTHRFKVDNLINAMDNIKKHCLI